jgi:hypothetical protein
MTTPSRVSVRWDVAPAGLSRVDGPPESDTGQPTRTAEGDTGRLTGVALGFPFAAVAPPSGQDRRREGTAGDAGDWAGRCDAALEAEHTLEPHRSPTLRAMRPGWRNHGPGYVPTDRRHARRDDLYLRREDLRRDDLRCEICGAKSGDAGTCDTDARPGPCSTDPTGRRSGRCGGCL